MSRSYSSGRFWKCSVCDLVFRDSGDYLSSEDEEKRYRMHRNDIGNPDYINYLKTVANPLKKFINKGARGLDYGCGPTKGMEIALSDSRVKMDYFDPFFYPQTPLKNQSYHFITSVESAEHFHSPHAEFGRISQLLHAKGGLFALRTEVWSGREEDFDSWWYQRDPTHVSFYSENSFAWLSNAYSWNTVYKKDNVIIFEKGPE